MTRQNETGSTGGQQGGDQQSNRQNGGQQSNRQNGGQQSNQQPGQQGADQQGANGGQPPGGQQGDGRRGAGLTEWFASSALRLGIVLVGFTLFLFALGQAVGLELLGMFVDAVTSQTGRWLVVAGFALLLILVGQQGVKHSSYSD